MKHADASSEAAPLQTRLVQLGRRLQTSLQAVVTALPEVAHRTAGFARYTETNKVFASRLLTALRQEDPLNVVHRLPGPDPLRRFLDGPSVRNTPARLVLAARDNVNDFQAVIEDEAGDRATLQTLMSSWPGATRGEFDQHRRQAAFKAVSALKGSSVDLDLSVSILHPAEDAGMMDLVWLIGKIGLQRLRPDAKIRLDTRRMSDEGTGRHPTTLGGDPLEGALPGGLEEYCPNGPAPLKAMQVGDTMNYLLAGNHFGPHERRDMLFIEVNRSELRRLRVDQPERKSFLYANPIPPAQLLVMDIWLHKSLLGSEPPDLLVYDTAGSGPKDPNDLLSSFDLLESAEQLEYFDGADGIPPLTQYSRYEHLLCDVMDQLGWSPNDFHLWRVEIACPLHSSQVTVVFQPTQ